MLSFRKCSLVCAIASLGLFTGCAGGGYSGMAASPAVTAAGQSAVNAASQAAAQSIVNSAAGAMGVQNPMMNAVLQNMTQSVINSQIGQQVQPADQNFRLQQLGGMVQQGAVNQNQQWSNPQTGSILSVTPVGQAQVDPATRQNCRDLEEVYTSSSGQQIRELRRACQDASGRWVLVQ
jgi:surface antigen